MDASQAASIIDGRQYREEVDSDLARKMKDADLVAVYGASDDLMEFDGAIHDEVGAWEGGTAHLDGSGLLENACENSECPHFERLKASAKVVEAVWAPEGIVGDPSWQITTEIPHKTFKIFEDDELYCIGVVFSLKDV